MIIVSVRIPETLVCLCENFRNILFTQTVHMVAIACPLNFVELKVRNSISSTSIWCLRQLSDDCLYGLLKLYL